LQSIQRFTASALSPAVSQSINQSIKSSFNMDTFVTDP